MSDDRPTNTDVVSIADDPRHRSKQEQATTDEMLRILASERRRMLLSYWVRRDDGPYPVDELVDVVAERERPDPGPATHRERILTDLHHVELPKLADAGVIDYDPVAGTVRYDGSNELESLLDASSEIG